MVLNLQKNFQSYINNAKDLLAHCKRLNEALNCLNTNKYEISMANEQFGSKNIKNNLY